jgi:TolB-like protein
MDDEARAAVASLLELEPPRMEFDPDMEPPPLMNLYYDVRKEKEGYEVGGGSRPVKTIAIIDFTNGSIGSDASDYDALSQGLASMMINMMGGSIDLKVVERERLQWLLDELDLQSEDGRVDQSTAVRMGKLIGAQSVLIGSFIVNDDDIYLGSRLVKVETGEIVLGEQIRGDVDDIFDLVQDLSVQTARSINVSLEESELGGADETRSLDAMISYSEGLALLDQASYQAAYNKFQEALEYDPNYARAKTRVESLRPMLN